MKIWFLAFIGVVAFAGFGQAGSKTAELIMFDSSDCEWCEVWEEQIGEGYHKTSESAQAPLRRVDIEDQETVKGLKRKVTYTPTFTVMSDGEEIGRITGYPGPDFFYPLLDDLIAKLQHPAS